MLAGAEWGRARAVPRLLAALLCVPPIYRIIAFPPPYQWTVTGSYLAQIRDRWQPGDVMYSTYDRSLEVLHSAPHFGLRPEDDILGPCDFSDPRRSLRAADALRGRRRAWVIVGSGRYFPFSPEYGYLRTIGVRRDSLPVRLPGTFRFGAPAPFDIETAYLFDLSDTTRLARATADTYVLSPLLRPVLRNADKWTCYGVWSPGVRESEQPGSGKTGERETGDGRRETGDGRRETGDGINGGTEAAFCRHLGDCMDEIDSAHAHGSPDADEVRLGSTFVSRLPSPAPVAA